MSDALRNPETWQKLETAPIRLSDGADLGALATELFDIRASTAATLLTEYRRFLYLVSVAGQVIAPSTKVDQIWHLHLADHEAWHAFSTAHFGRELRHLPGRPPPERDPAYLRTLALIREEFDSAPDAEFWPDPNSRSQKGADSLNALFIGLAITAGITWLFGWGWGLIALILSLIVSVERYVATPSKRLKRRGNGSDSGGVMMGAEEGSGRQSFDNRSGDYGGDGDGGGGCGGGD